MKKVLALVAVVGLISAASAAFGATIVGSKHDLSPSGGATQSGGTSTQICIYCHAPHNANLALPLWNRTNPTASVFTLYSGLNMQNVSFKSGFTSDSTSLFCMSCHDGVTNINAVHNAGAIDGTGVTGMIHTAAAGVFATATIPSTTPAAIGGRNLSKTHPINFPVSTVDGQSDLWPGTGSTMGVGNAFTVRFPLFKSTAGTGQSATRSTTNRSLECGSCHAVHDSQNSPFLRDTMNNSQLCLGCHNK